MGSTKKRPRIEMVDYRAPANTNNTGNKALRDPGKSRKVSNALFGGIAFGAPAYFAVRFLLRLYLRQ